MMKIFDKYKYAKHYKKLLLACYFFYFCTMAIKLTYSVQLVEIIAAFKTSKAEAAFGLTIYYFVYAAAQVLLSLFIQKINLKRYFLITTVLSAISFSLIGISTELWQLWLIFALNGVFQSAGWGGITFILGKLFPDETLSYSSKFLSTGFASSNAGSYAISAVFVQFFSWQYTFVFFAVIYILALLIMLYEERKLEGVLRTGEELKFAPEPGKVAKYMVPADVHFSTKIIFSFILTACFVVTTVLYGVGNWIPNLLTEVHSFPTSLSLLITLIMPLVVIPANIIMYNFFDKTNKIVRSSMYIGGALLLALVVMAFGYGWNLPFAIIMCVIVRFLSAAFATPYSSYVLMKFKHHLNTGSSVLISNALAALGAGLAPFITGAVMDAAGWKWYYIVLGIFVIVALVMGIFGDIYIRKNKKLSEYI